FLGLDCKSGPNNESHHHGDHPRKINKDMPIKLWINNFTRLAEDLKSEGVEVINSTRDTALNCFNKVKLEDALCLS
ncbi:MAG: hypothetical protein PHT95_07795, partial [Candidatus Omnitrophica bacterium]|nr:hypothetical protein [Candidatus Omnitrophota bacterium]